MVTLRDVIKTCMYLATLGCSCLPGRGVVLVQLENVALPAPGPSRAGGIPPRLGQLSAVG